MYIAPLLLLFVEEAGIELFVPGDFVVLFFGYHVARGHLPFWFAFLLLFAVVMLGTSILYFLAHAFGERVILKIGKYIHFRKEELDSVEELFRKYGVWALIIARHIPGLRMPTVIFAGVSEISYLKFFISSCVSVIPWILFYLSLGRRVGPKALTLFHEHQAFGFLMVIPVLILFCAYYVLKTKMAQRKASDTKHVKK